ncbi:MAG: methyltransferase domain-containing protein [Chloroflexota bacterium]|nr:methyltransferase domain-containing protein [Chloroflexota bacterium]
MAKFDHFDFISPLYDFVFGRRTHHEIVDFADVSEDQTLLDLGGGTGRVSVLFKMKVKNLFVADSSANMLKEAKDKGLITLNSNSERLPFRDDSIQRIIMVDAFHHVRNQQETLQEMWRVLEQDGLIIIEEPDINYFYVKLIALGEKILMMRSHFVSPSRIAELGYFDGHASVDIKRRKGNAWITIKKIKGEIING